MALGIILSLATLFGWAFGDFFTQKATRTIGIWKTMFFNGLFGVVAFFPFSYSDLHLIFAGKNILLLTGMSALGVFSAWITFHAFKLGKLSVVEPIFGLELPLTLILTTFLWHEILPAYQVATIVLIFIGIIFTATTHFKELIKFKVYFEKGTIYAIIGAFCLAFANLFTGIASQTISPLTAFWFIHAFFLVITTIYILNRGDFGELAGDFKINRKIIFVMMILNAFAWLFFSYATTMAPIAIVTAISESYIALAVLLGIVLNREKILLHQKIGIALVFIGIVTLAIIS